MSHLIVFDLDGTLVDTAPDLVGALNIAMLAENLPVISLEVTKSLVGAGARALVERGLAYHGAKPDAVRTEELIQMMLAAYEQAIAVESRAYPGVLEALLDLKSQGWRFAVCTNKPERYAIKLLAELKMLHWFEAVCGGDSFAFRKPDPRHLTETIAKSGGGRALMVGDSRTDVDTARAAGIPVIGVSFGYTDIPMRDLKPDVLIDHFDAFTSAVRRLT